MAGIPTQIDGVLLGDAPALLYAVPADRRLVVKQVSFTNLDSMARAISLHNAAPADPATTANAVVYQANLGAGASALLPMTMVLGPGDQILAGASVAGVVSCTIVGLLYENDDEPQPAVLHRGLVTAAPTEVYAGPVGVTTVVKHLTLCNVTIADRQVSAYFVPDGATLDDAHLVLRRTIPARSTLFEAMSFMLGEGDGLHLEASAASTVAAVVSGVAA